MGFIGSTLGTLILESGVTVRAMAWVFKLAPMLAVILVSLSMASSTVLAVTILGIFLVFNALDSCVIVSFNLSALLNGFLYRSHFLFLLLFCEIRVSAVRAVFPTVVPS